MRKKQLLIYGALGVGAYLLYQHVKRTQAPAVVVPTTVAPTQVAGLGYFPDGSDRPFAMHAGRYWRGRA